MRHGENTTVFRVFGVVLLVMGIGGWISPLNWFLESKQIIQIHHFTKLDGFFGSESLETGSSTSTIPFLAIKQII